jgi:predicted glycosyltransferase
MGGYNTISEVLSFEKHALVVPRVKPRLEQYIRAVRLKNLDMIDILHPDKLNPNTLSDWMARDVKKDLSLRNKIDMNGLKRLPGMLTELLKTSSHTRQCKFYTDRVRFVAN